MSIYQSLWLESQSCAGPPDSLLIFNANETSQEPIFYDYLNNEAESIDICGFCPVAIPSGCCWVTYHPSETGGYSSTLVSPILDAISDEAIRKWTPESAIGSQYCLLQYDGDNGPISRYLLDRVGACYEDAISCVDGIVTIHVNSTEACQGPVLESYSTLNTTAVDSLYFGAGFQVSKTVFHQASQKVIWEAYVPQTENVIYLNTPGRIVAGVGMLIGAAISLVGSIWMVIRLSRTRTLINLWLGFIQFLSIAETLTLFTWLYIPQYSPESYLLYYEFVTLMQSIVTLSLALMNVQFVITIIPLKVWDTSLQKSVIYLIVIVIHFAMAWPNWVGYLVPSSAFLYTWDSTGFPLWAFVSITSCTGSVLFLVSYKLLKLLRKSKQKATPSTVLSTLSEKMPSSFALATMSLFDLLLFLATNITEWYTPWAGNDLDQQILEFYAWIPFPIQALVTIWLLEISQGYLSEHGVVTKVKTEASVSKFLRSRVLKFIKTEGGKKKDGSGKTITNSKNVLDTSKLVLDHSKKVLGVPEIQIQVEVVKEVIEFKVAEAPREAEMNLLSLNKRADFQSMETELILQSLEIDSSPAPVPTDPTADDCEHKE